MPTPIGGTPSTPGATTSKPFSSSTSRSPSFLNLLALTDPPFSRPNEISQSNISPDDAVPIWKEYMAPLKAKGYKLGMAAPTNAPSGLEWVKVRPPFPTQVFRRVLTQSLNFAAIR
jgi:hypothetical protein